MHPLLRTSPSDAMGTSTWVSGGRSLISADAPVITSTDGVKSPLKAACSHHGGQPRISDAIVPNSAVHFRLPTVPFRANSELFPVSLSYGIRVILRCTTTGHESHFLRILARCHKRSNRIFVHSFCTLCSHRLSRVTQHTLGLINCSTLAVTHSRPARSLMVILMIYLHTTIRGKHQVGKA